MPVINKNTQSKKNRKFL